MLTHFDEACNGYDSYSILKTCHTMHNEYLPLFAKSTGDFRETIYHYIDMPFIWLFGLNEISIKLPAIIFSILSSILIFYIVKDITKNKKTAIISSILFIFNPSMLVFSTMAFRLNIYLFLFTASLFAIERFYYRMKSKYLIIFAIFSSISLWSYFSARAFIPIYLIATAIIFRKKIFEKRIYFLISSGIILITSTFLLTFWLSPMGMARANSELKLDFFHLFLNYISYFNPLKLFIGLNNQSIIYNLPYVGNFYWWEFITIVAGLYLIFKTKLKKDNFFKLLIFLFFIYPIPANLTGKIGDLFIQRSIHGIVILTIISSIGLEFIYSKIKTKQIKYLYNSLFILSILIVIFIRFDIMPKQPKAINFNYGVKEVLNITNQKKYQNVLIDDRLYFWHMFILFYNKVNPKLLEKNPIKYNMDPNISKSKSPFYNIKIGKFRFVNIHKLPKLNNFLLIVKDDIKISPHDKNFKLLKKIDLKYKNKTFTAYTLLTHNN